jgi:hypothetical protein
MKWSTLEQHKKVIMLCEEGMTTIEARNALSIPQKIKQVTPPNDALPSHGVKPT